MAAWRYEISLLVLKKYFTRSLRSLVKYFSTLEEKFRISARPCNILYLRNILTTIIWLKRNKGHWFLYFNLYTATFSHSSTCVAFFGSVKVSGKLLTYPSPNPTFCPK